jgi:hypothetical protein
MKRFIAGLTALALLTVAVAFSRSDRPGGELTIRSEDRNPWTGLTLNNDRDDFQFAIVSDRTGGHRARIFSQAVDRLNLMQPEFVICVGDLIEGGGKKPAKQVLAEWDEFDGYVKRLKMPFFYVSGNHDVGAVATDKLWRERYGRTYYHFLYKNVLFLVLNTDDPPGSGSGHLGKEQADWARGVLEANKDVRHTIVALHKPIWNSPRLPETRWLEVEKALADRPYTVFCGHVHRFRKYVRQGRNYYQLSTTGGGSKMRGVEYGEFDHIVWVTMKKEGPVFANLLLDSILPEDLQTPKSDEKAAPLPKLLPTLPVKGTVFLDGSAVAGAYVVFEGKPGEDKKKGPRADAVTEADGSFVLSTYSAFDGAPAWEYTVTVELRKPLVDELGKPGKNLLPERYAKPDTSPLRFTVSEGDSNVVLQLTR